MRSATASQRECTKRQSCEQIWAVAWTQWCSIAFTLTKYGSQPKGYKDVPLYRRQGEAHVGRHEGLKHGVNHPDGALELVAHVRGKPIRKNISCVYNH